TYAYVEGQDGDRQSTETVLIWRTEFNRRDGTELAYQRQFERLEQPFAIRPDAVIPAGDYVFTQVGLNGSTDSSRRLYGGAQASTGSFYHGNRTDLGGSLGFRQSQH